LSGIKQTAVEGKNIASFEDQAGAAAKMREMVAPYTSLTYIFLCFGMGIAFAISYNTASIALMERKREYSTLRVLGLQVREISGILGFEYWTLGFCGILLGIPLAKAFKLFLAAIIKMDQFSMPTGIARENIITAAVCMCIAIFWSNRSIIKQVARMDMVEVLKERE